jgi:tetratricopeptide (TPR) repeat protein
VRTFVIPSLVLVVSALSAFGEVIHLKNGDTIYADRVQENGSRVQYDVEDNSYTIPRNKVQTIETGRGRGAPTGAVSSSAEVPVYTPEVQVSGEQNLSQIVQGHEVNRGALAAVESRGNPGESAIAYYIAAKAEFGAGKYVDSRRDFETALRYQSDNPAILTYYAALLVRTGDGLNAISFAQRATRIVPDSPDALAVLGFAQFASSRYRDAIESWKKSLAARPDATISQMIKRARREIAAETNFSEQETGHFILRYEGNQSSATFRDELLSTLEADYQDLSREFATQPRSSIRVVLYPTRAFFDVTRAPSWTGALNDGTVRIPLQGLASVTPELARVLRHELVHSFVNQITTGRCPEWLNEGIAQLLEPRSIGDRAGRLAQLFHAHREIPLNMLEHGFSSLSGSEAALAYDESLAAVEYIQEQHGMTDIVRLLQRIGEGDSTEVAMRSVLHSDYGGLEEELGAHLIQQAGN